MDSTRLKLMFFSKASKKALDDLEEYKVDMADLKEDLNTFKKNIETDLVNIRKDFKELILFLQESGNNEESPAMEERVGTGQEANTIEALKTDLALIRESVDGLIERTDKIKSEINKTNDNIENGITSVKKKINDARKDINNKISYAVARLKT